MLADLTSYAATGSAIRVRTEWHCRLSGLKLRRVAGEQFRTGLVTGLPQ